MPIGFHTIFTIAIGLSWLLTATVFAIVLSLLKKKRPLVKGVIYGAASFIILMVMNYLGRGLHIMVVQEIFYLLGMFLYVAFLVTVPVFLVCKVLGLISKSCRTKNKTQLMVMAGLTMLVFLTGVYNAQTFRVIDVELTSDKLQQEHNIVLIGDVHVGSESRAYLAKIVSKINELNPDMVLINGDLIDDRSISVHELDELNDIKTKIYYVNGNHDYIAEKTEELSEIRSLDKLDNEARDLGEISLIGINSNLRRRNQTNIAGIYDRIGMDTSKYLITLIHEPIGIDETSRRGVDLMLAGHTHGGQIWPYHYFHQAAYGYLYGLYDIDGMKLYITSGAGAWGPNFRLGTRNEIVQIRLRPGS
ncbi:TPA: hypothetical protein HA265_00515 [Candidatus Woesearchaeota archaeon]|nr:hypothetical protein [Candidatus Woesearchaeota archaeon]